MAALEVYRGIHAAIRRNGYDVFTRRAGTTRPQKLGLALRRAAGGLLALRRCSLVLLFPS